MSRLVGLAGQRFFVRHPWQLALAILGVALGVAVVTGVDLAAGSARRGVFAPPGYLDFRVVVATSRGEQH